MRQSRPLVVILCVLACTLPIPLPSAAQEGFAGLCSLFLHQTQTEMEELELAVQTEQTRLAVAEEIFVLLDGMWQNDLLGRLPYVAAKHRRDAAEIGLRLARRRVDRQQAVVDQYGLACSAPSAQERTSGDRAAIEDVQRSYVEADCEVRALDVALFEVDLEYYQEMLASARDLRQSDVASRQQVLFAEQDLQLTLQQLEQARMRVERCRQ